MRVVIAVLLLLSLSLVAAEAVAKKPGACVADELGPLRVKAPKRRCEDDDVRCRRACFRGDASSCYERALVLETKIDTRPDALILFRRGCALGLAIACTNFAASIWAADGKGPDMDCAMRLFQRSCAAGEPFACGMEARIVLEEAKRPEDVKRGRDLLENACERLKGFPCRVLAMHFESGRLGPYEKERITQLLARACEGGDPDACGAAPTATETFKGSSPPAR